MKTRNTNTFSATYNNLIPFTKGKSQNKAYCDNIIIHNNINNNNSNYIAQINNNTRSLSVTNFNAKVHNNNYKNMLSNRSPNKINYGVNYGKIMQGVQSLGNFDISEQEENENLGFTTLKRISSKRHTQNQNFKFENNFDNLNRFKNTNNAADMANIYNTNNINNSNNSIHNNKSYFFKNINNLKFNNNATTTKNAFKYKNKINTDNHFIENFTKKDFANYCCNTESDGFKSDRNMKTTERKWKNLTERTPNEVFALKIPKNLLKLDHSRTSNSNFTFTKSFFIFLFIFYLQLNNDTLVFLSD